MKDSTQEKATYNGGLATVNQQSHSTSQAPGGLTRREEY